MNSQSFFKRTVYALLGIAAVFSLTSADNPIISHRFTADPNATVYDGRVYVFCSNDDDNHGSYGLSSYILLSSDDMVNWTDHGEIFRVPRDAPWASRAFAPTAIERDGKFYLYFPDGGNSVGVAVADRIEGPYVDPLEKPLIDKSLPNCNVQWLFDPAVFIDDDGQAYIYFGGGNGRHLRGMKLNDDMISVSGSAVTINAPGSFEASFMHKHDGKYYFSYAAGSFNSTIQYLIGDDPLGPFSHKGVVLDNPSLNGRNINGSNNSHASIIEFEGKSYMFYHDRRISGGTTHKRNASLDLLEYNGDGTMKKVRVTSESVPQIKKFYPYDTVQCETMDKQSGIETDVCSEGGTMLTDISNGDYTSLSGVDFGEGATGFSIRASSESGGGTVELHLGSKDGDLAGTCEISATGAWDTWKTFTCGISDCEGVNDLYIVYKGAGEPYRLNWFKFESPNANLSSAKSIPMRKVGKRQRLSIAVQGKDMPAGFGTTLFTLNGRTLQKSMVNNSGRTSKGAYVIIPEDN